MACTEYSFASSASGAKVILKWKQDPLQSVRVEAMKERLRTAPYPINGNKDVKTMKGDYKGAYEYRNLMYFKRVIYKVQDEPDCVVNVIEAGDHPK